MTASEEQKLNLNIFFSLGFNPFEQALKKHSAENNQILTFHSHYIVQKPFLSN